MCTDDMQQHYSPRRTCKNSLTTHLKYASTVRRAPGVQQVVFASAHKPLSAVRELERQHTAVMKV